MGAKRAIVAPVARVGENRLRPAQPISPRHSRTDGSRSASPRRARTRPIVSKLGRAGRLRSRLEPVTPFEGFGLTPVLTPASLRLGSRMWHAGDSKSSEPAVVARCKRQWTASVHIRKQQVRSSNLRVGSSSPSRSESAGKAANLVAWACHNAEDLLTDRIPGGLGPTSGGRRAWRQSRGSNAEPPSPAVFDAAGLPSDRRHPPVLRSFVKRHVNRLHAERPGDLRGRNRATWSGGAWRAPPAGD